MNTRTVHWRIPPFPASFVQMFRAWVVVSPARGIAASAARPLHRTSPQSTGLINGTHCEFDIQLQRVYHIIITHTIST